MRVKLMSGASARVARALLEDGPATAASLAQALDLTPTAVRRHLDVLVDAGFATASERVPFGPSPTRGRGRPARVFSLTQEGREAFHQSYDDLAISALRYLATTHGDEAVTQFGRARFEQRLADVRSASDLAAALSADGYAVTVEPGPGGGVQICQHHCPVGHVAEEFPQLCEAEAAVFSEVLDTHVMRLATIARGDAVCTTLIPKESE